MLTIRNSRRKIRRTWLQALPLESRVTPATFTVTNNLNAGAGSLRQAVIDANMTAAHDVIQFQAGLPSPIVLTTGSIAINQPLTIDGPSADLLTISGNDLARIFNTGGAAAGTNIAISGLTLTKGNAATNGGAVFVGDEDVTFTNCTLTGNTAVGHGGAVYADSGVLIFDGCTVSGNAATGAGKGGGGIFVGSISELTIISSSISGNTAEVGGGIAVYLASGLSVNSSAITNNTATGKYGGGIHVVVPFGNGMDGLIVNTTISGNQAQGAGSKGGGIFWGSVGVLTVQNSTVTSNTATGMGGGIANPDSVSLFPFTLLVRSSIVAKNTCAGSPDIAGKANVAWSFVGNTAGANLTGTPLTGDPLLGPLANNGGPTQSHALLNGSPCINTGNAYGLVLDQRGDAFLRAAMSPADIGSFEVQHDFYVTNNKDAGAGSLRQAIINANANPGQDSIFISAGLADNTITLTTGEIAISESVTIQAFSAPVNVSGNSVNRIFNMTTAPNGAAVSIKNMSFIDGFASSSGGAIRGDNQDLTLDNCVFFDNATSAFNGGAVSMFASGTVTATNCTFTNNLSAASGGALHVAGASAKALIHDCVFSGNSADNGGAIFAQNYLLLTGSTLSGNAATAGRGGAIYLSGYLSSGIITVRNSTISGNKSSANGGGIALVEIAGALTVQNTTITNNAATALLTTGGGISRVSGAGSIAIESSVVSGNTCNTGPDVFSAGTVNVKTSSVGSGAGFTKTDLGGNLPFQPHANLALGSLAFNGGPRQTHVPLTGSPLIDAGSNPIALANDQRGPGFARLIGANADIGSVEVQHSFIVVNNANSGLGSLRQTIINANDNPGADTILFDFAKLAGETITLTTGEIAISESLTIDGPDSSFVAISGNKFSRIFNTQSTAGGRTLAFDNLMMFDGKALGLGGAIIAGDENVVLTDCTFFDNQATTDSGGAIAMSGSGKLTATDCTFADNSSANRGGAISVAGALSMTVLQRCNVTGNTALAGGGVYARNYLFIESSTLANNQATAGIGGGIMMSGYPSGGNMVVRNCTISGNSSTDSGGGIVLVSFNGIFNYQNSTLTNNKATGPASKGGGISLVTGSGTIALESGIVSGNFNVMGPDVFSGGTVQMKSSAVGSGLGFAKTDLGGNLQFQAHANLKLGLLADNGGPMLTHKPQADSPLLNVGTNPAGLSFDQRGVTRQFGAGLEMGSVEVVTSLIVTNDNNAGLGSLRQNISDANIEPGANTISFSPVFFATPKTITLSGGSLRISDDVTVNGPGAAIVTVSGNNSSRVFSIDGPNSLDVTLKGMTITKGGSVNFGGGVFSYAGDLTVQNCIISGNSPNSSWAGIFTQGFLRLIDSQVTNNTAPSSVGGVASAGGAEIVRSIISGNTATTTSGGLSVSGELSLVDSVVSGNSAGSNGGGITITGAGPVTIMNSTISGNIAGGSGGGIQLGHDGGGSFNGTLTIQNATITNNLATGSGGGIERLMGTGTISLESSIVSGNTGSVGGPDVYSTGTVNASTSLIGTISGITTFMADAFTNVNIGKAPLLGPLANNGGPTPTHALLPGSPAINNGANLLLLANDQRGPGFPRSIGIGPDIGAFEVQPGAQVTSVIVNNGDVQRSRVTSIAVTFDQHLVFTGGSVDAFQLKRQNDGKLPTLSAQVDDTGMGTIVTLTFSGATAVDFGSLADGRYTLTVLANQIGAAGLDGNGDFIPGDNYELIGDPLVAPRLFRLFGDADGNGLVSAVDFNAFRLAYGLNGPSIFDFDDSGLVSAIDFNEFRLRYGATV